MRYFVAFILCANVARAEIGVNTDRAPTLSIGTGTGVKFDGGSYSIGGSVTGLFNRNTTSSASVQVVPSPPRPSSFTDSAIFFRNIGERSEVDSAGRRRR